MCIYLNETLKFNTKAQGIGENIYQLNLLFYFGKKVYIFYSMINNIYNYHKFYQIRFENIKKSYISIILIT